MTLLEQAQFTDQCPDCGTVSVAATRDELDGLRCACARPSRVVQYVASLVCIHCGRLVTEVVLSDPRQPIRVPPGQRCGACGGRPIVGDIDKRISEAPPPRFKATRRGRPSKQRMLDELLPISTRSESHP